MKTGIIFILLLIGNFIFSQNLSWVLYDTPIGDEFHEGLASFYKDGKSGAINTFGQIVIPPKFNYSFNFHNGIAKIKDAESGKYGLIDMRGNYITQPIYNSISDFEEGVAIVEKDNKYGLINQSGEVTLPIEYDEINTRDIYFELKIGDLMGVAGLNGKMIFPPQYSFIYVYEDYPILELSKGDQVIYFNLNSNQIIDYKYDKHSFGYIGAGIATVRINKRQFYIDENGQKIASNLVNTSKHGVYCFQDSITKKWGFKSSTVKVIISPIYDDVGEIFINDFMKVSNISRTGYVNCDGIEVIKPLYISSNNFQKGFVIARNDKNKYGVINSLGEIIVPFDYNYIEKIQDKILKVTNDLGDDGIFNVEEDFKNTTFYNYIEDYSNGYFVVRNKVNDKYLHGIINNKGVEIIPTIYDRVEDFNEGMVLVESMGVNSIINEKGVIVFRDSPEYSIQTGFSEGVASVIDNKNWKYGYIANPYFSLSKIKAIYTQKAYQTMPDEYYAQGNDLLSSNNYMDAILYYTKAIELNNKFSNAYINRGVCYYYLGNYPKAIDNYSAALSIDPTSTIAKSNLKSAKLSLSAQKWDKTSAILNAISQGVNTFSYSSSPNNNSSSGSNPSNNSSPSENSSGSMQRSVCPYCKGTKVQSTPSYGPSYGLDRSSDKKCDVCGKYENHYHANCIPCQGKGYIDKFVP